MFESGVLGWGWVESLFQHPFLSRRVGDDGLQLDH